MAQFWSGVDKKSSPILKEQCAPTEASVRRPLKERCALAINCLVASEMQSELHQIHSPGFI
ncbi:MAG TPA: hypothetical protein VII84_01700, partial [Acidimicrobiales bacterium]